MANALPHRPDQLKEAERLAKDAQFLGQKVLSAKTITMAPILVNNLLNIKGDGPLSEGAADIRILRSDGKFTGSLAKDISVSQEMLTDEMLNAMTLGFVSEMEFQVTQIKGLTFELTDEDHADMNDYPIQGHTCEEISAYMHGNFKYEIEGLLSSPLVGDSQINALPEFIGAAITRFGYKCSNAVDEAYFAGVQLALRGVAKAIGAA